MGYELEPEIKKVLTEMNFVEKYKQLSDKYQGDKNNPYGMQKYDITEVMNIFHKMGYNAKYDKREKFFKLNVEEYPEKKCKIWCNVLVNYGRVEFVWTVYHNNSVKFGIPMYDYSRLLVDIDYVIPAPRYRSYEELEEIFKAEFSLFDDFKERVLKEYE